MTSTMHHLNQIDPKLIHQNGLFGMWELEAGAEILVRHAQRVQDWIWFQPEDVPGLELDWLLLLDQYGWLDKRLVEVSGQSPEGTQIHAKICQYQVSKRFMDRLQKSIHTEERD